MMDRLIQRIIETKNPTVVGIDPRISYIPQDIMETSFKEHGKTPKGVSMAFYRFSCAIIDSIHDLVPAVKPQIAMFEQLGADGIDAYIKTITYAKHKGLIVIGDIKRGDIASTAEDYASGHIGKVTIAEDEVEIFGEDFVTLSPYLGHDSILPFVDCCKKHRKGIFVLVKTSNVGSGDIQDLLVDGTPIYEKVGLQVDEWGKELIGKYGYSAVGAVVGATYPAQGAALRKKMPRTFFLIPGYGAQGATAKDLVGCFDKNGLGGIVNSSRAILSAHLTKAFSHLSFEKATRQAAIDMQQDLYHHGLTPQQT